MRSAAVERIAALLPMMQQGAGALDDAAAFPETEIAALRDAGILALPLPIEQDLEVQDELTDQLARALVLTGMGNLSVGRLFEAHINARHLIGRYGRPEQQTACARDVADGHLFGLWVTDPPEHGLRMTITEDGIRLRGGKMFCSGAGQATRALVTAANEHGEPQMLVVAVGDTARMTQLASPLQGMRAAVTGAVDFTDQLFPHSAALGKPGDYLKEPEFSAGAWRGSAVAVGGLRALLEHALSQLRAAGRMDNPHHLHRMGTAMIAHETSRQWLQKAARAAEDRAGDPATIVATVGLARIAIEAACLDAMRLVQRSLGLSAFRHGNPVECICRDLGTYLRQPAPDDVLSEAASHFARNGIQDWP